MRERKFITAEIDEKKWEQVETFISRLARRSSKVATGIITPYPISKIITTPEPDGTLFRYFFPMSGKIVRAAAFVEGFPKEGITLTVSLELGVHEVTSQSLRMEKNSVVVDLDVKTVVGHRLRVTTNASPVAQIKYWLGLVWIPEASEVETKQFIIDELLKLEDDFAEEKKAE